MKHEGQKARSWGAAAKVLALTLVALVSGCAHRPPTVDSNPLGIGGVRDAVDPHSTLARLIAERGQLLFRSYSGRVYGTDCDTEIEFRGDHNVALCEFGFSVGVYEGRYQVNEQGHITLELPTYQGDWPAMRLREKAGAFYLYTVSGDSESSWATGPAPTCPPTWRPSGRSGS